MHVSCKANLPPAGVIGNTSPVKRARGGPESGTRGLQGHRFVRQLAASIPADPQGRPIPPGAATGCGPGMFRPSGLPPCLRQHGDRDGGAQHPRARLRAPLRAAEINNSLAGSASNKHHDCASTAAKCAAGFAALQIVCLHSYQGSRDLLACLAWCPPAGVQRPVKSTRIVSTSVPFSATVTSLLERCKSAHNLMF